MTSPGIDTANYTWHVEAGETEGLVIPVLDGETPLDVTGWPVDAKIKTNPGGPLLFEFPDDLIEADGSEVTLRLPAMVSEDWAFTTGWLRVKVTDPASPPGNPATYRILQGPVLVDLD